MDIRVSTATWLLFLSWEPESGLANPSLFWIVFHPEAENKDFSPNDFEGAAGTYSRAALHPGGGMVGPRRSERPMCPTCKHRMGLARISAGEWGFEQITFECSTCHRTEKIPVAEDPMKTDAVGWLQAS